MIYLIRIADCPNVAAQNRLSAFINGFNALGLNYRLVFIQPTHSLDKSSNLNAKKIYLWKAKRTGIKWIDYTLYQLWAKLFCKVTLNLFCRNLKKGDIIVDFSATDFLHKFVKCKDIKVFAERTEHPEVVCRPKTEKLMSQYIEDCKKLAGIFVISTSLKSYFKSIGVSEDKIHIINMVVDPNRFINLRKQEIKERYIAYCGTASNSKDGVDDLIRSFAIVSKQIPDIKLYIIGKIPNKKEAHDNLNLINELGIKDKVVLTGIISSSKMPQLLKNAECLVLARPDSIQAENGFPTKLGEYLLTKNPVVITRTGDIPKFLEDGVSALICEPQNCEEIAQKICWVLNNKSAASKIGENGYNVALKSFNSITESKKIYDVLVN